MKLAAMPADPRYPLGPAPTLHTLTPEQRTEKLTELALLPDQLAAALAGLDSVQLATPYRAGGWTVRQLAHHVADSHLNAYLRTKLALTEARPVITPYDENAWAELPDSRLPIAPSLEILRGVHTRWAELLRGVGAEEWQRVFIHPEHGENTLDRVLSLYVWHGQHHTAHVLGLRRARDW